MASGIAPFRAALDEVEVRTPPFPVVSSANADFFGDQIRDALAASLVSPIRWTAVLGRLGDLGVTRYLDVGPGKVLAGLVRRTVDSAEIETPASRESALA
jgi:[acyl-carrier-protein] S-malonyltransferase